MIRSYRIVARSMLLVAVLAFAPLAGTRAVAADAPARTEVPLTALRLPNGRSFLGLPIVVGATRLQAVFDLGTIGLRVAPGMVSADDFRDSHQVDRIVLVGGQIQGELGTASVAIGTLRGTVNMQLIAPCASGSCSPPDFPLEVLGLASADVPGAGYQALFGASLRGYDPAISQPMAALGARRWIVDVPRESGESGRVVLNPTDMETVGYAMLPVARAKYDASLASLHDPLDGCIVNGRSGERVCGSVQLHLNGSPNVVVAANPPLGATWQDGTPVTFELRGERDAVRATMPFAVGPAPRGGVAFVRLPQLAPTQISVGLTFFRTFSVLYDAQHDAIGLKPRPSDDGFAGSVRP